MREYDCVGVLLSVITWQDQILSSVFIEFPDTLHVFMNYQPVFNFFSNNYFCNNFWAHRNHFLWLVIPHFLANVYEVVKPKIR